MSNLFTRVAVLMGGPSSEREISLRSGAAVVKGLQEAGYEVTGIDVKGHELELPPDVEAVFVALHGEFGEDGQIQGLLDSRRVSYTGSGAAASRASFDKITSKEICAAHGILTPSYELLRKGDRRSLPLPVVVKPACQGSSIGVNRVMSESEWEDAAGDSFRYGDQILVETYIPGRELTAGVVGQQALPLVEIVAPGGWYDYKAKYTRGASQYLVPAPIDDSIYRRCQDLAVSTFNALGCRGFGRVDFRLSPDGELYALELNNIPGFTETSLLPKAAAQAGISFPELCDRIIRMATFG